MVLSLISFPTVQISTFHPKKINSVLSLVSSPGCKRILILICPKYSTHTKQAGVAVDLGYRGVAVAVPAATRIVSGSRSQLLAKHHLDHMLVPLDLRIGCNLLVDLVGYFTGPLTGHVLVIGFVWNYSVA